MAREASYPKIPIGIAFATSNRSNAKYKVKVVNNRNIDELMNLNYCIPGIPSKAIIKEVVMGKLLCDRLIEKYKDK